jgi:hypothetical protein
VKTLTEIDRIGEGACARTHSVYEKLRPLGLDAQRGVPDTGALFFEECLDLFPARRRDLTSTLLEETLERIDCLNRPAERGVRLPQIIENRKVRPRAVRGLELLDGRLELARFREAQTALEMCSSERLFRTFFSVAPTRYDAHGEQYEHRQEAA